MATNFNPPLFSTSIPTIYWNGSAYCYLYSTNRLGLFKSSPGFLLITYPWCFLITWLSDYYKFLDGHAIVRCLNITFSSNYHHCYCSSQYTMKGNYFLPWAIRLLLGFGWTNSSFDWGWSCYLLTKLENTVSNLEANCSNAFIRVILFNNFPFIIIVIPFSFTYASNFKKAHSFSLLIGLCFSDNFHNLFTYFEFLLISERLLLLVIWFSHITFRRSVLGVLILSTFSINFPLRLIIPFLNHRELEFIVQVYFLVYQSIPIILIKLVYYFFPLALPMTFNLLILRFPNFCLHSCSLIFLLLLGVALSYLFIPQYYS